MPDRRRALYLSTTVVLIMLDTLRRLFARNSWFFAISIWTMQFLVLVFVVRDSVARALRKRKIRTRSDKLLALMSRGQDLQRAAPSVNKEHERVEGWSASVDAWTKETLSSLGSSCSPKAVAVFAQAATLRRTEYHYVNQSVWGVYDLLVQHIDSLRGIIEKPDVYY